MPHCLLCALSDVQRAFPSLVNTFTVPSGVRRGEFSQRGDVRGVEKVGWKMSVSELSPSDGRRQRANDVTRR
jgi:hypothetical protein